MRKCAICDRRTTDGYPWTSDTLHPEYKGQFLCRACSLALHQNSSVSSTNETATKSSGLFFNRSCLDNAKKVSSTNRAATKSSGSRVYIFMGILLAISAGLVLYPSGTAFIEAANALPSGSSWSYYSSHYSELTQTFYKALMQFFGFVALFVVIGLGISHLYDTENSR